MEEFLGEKGADLEIMETEGSTRRGRAEKKSRTRLTHDKHTCDKR